MVFVENSIAAIGITTKECLRLSLLPQREKKDELLANLHAYANEVIENQPVSNHYSYWFGPDNCLYTRKSLEPIYKAESQFDLNERGGAPLAGFRKLTKLLGDNPNKVILWYSPPGPAAYDDDPENDYSAVTYTYGQLYLNFFDGEKVNAIAVKTTNHDAVKQLMSPVFFLAQQQPDEQAKITAFLNKPFVTDFSFEEFLSQNWDDCLVYDKEGQKYFLKDVFGQIKANWGKARRSTRELFDKTIDALMGHEITEAVLLKAYLNLVYKKQLAAGSYETRLFGSCGGSVINRGDLEDILGIDNNPFRAAAAIHSTAFRIITQSDFGYYPDYQCPKCGTKLKGEKKNDSSSWKKQCPHCQKEFNCAK